MKTKLIENLSILARNSIIMFMTFLFFSCAFSKFGTIDCDYSNPIENALCKENNKLNNAVSEKDWKTVYEFKQKAKNNSIGCVDTYKAFKSSVDKKYYWATLNVKMVSFKIKDDHGETYNLREGKFLLWPFKTKIDTVLHKWRYKNNQWFLYDWDRGVKDLPDEWDKDLMKEIENR